MTDTAPSTRDSARGWWIAVAALVLTLFLAGAAWSLMSAPFTKTDEPRHINSVVRLMEGGGWPAPREAPMLDAVRIAAAEADHPLAGDDADPTPRGERSALNVTSGAERGVDGDPDWMTQHPPGFYGLTAGILKAVGAHGWSWDHAILLMRLLSDLWIALAAIPMALAARRISGSPRGALVAAAGVLAIPQYFHVGGLVSNDSLSVLIASTLLWLSAVLMDSPRAGWRLPLVVGLVLGAGLFTKGLFVMLIPVVGIAVLVAALREHGRSWRSLLAPALAMAVAFAVGGWWYVRNYVLYGAFQPSNFGSGRNDAPVEGYDLMEFVRTAAFTLNQTFWGSQRSSLALPQWFTMGALLVTVGFVVVGFVRSRHRLLLLVLAIYPVALMATTLHHAWEIYWNLGAFRGIQGRYLFPAIGILVILVAEAWGAFDRGGRQRVARVAAPVVILALATVAGAGWLLGSRLMWPEASSATEALRLMAEASGVPDGVALLLPVLCAGAVAWLAVAVTGPQLAHRREAVEA